VSTHDNFSDDGQDRLESAADWWNRLRIQPFLELSPEFEEWMSVPGNRTAFEAVESAMAALQDFAATPKILDMRRTALTELRNAVVHPRPVWGRLSRIAAALLLLGVLGGGLMYFVHSSPEETYATQVNERRTVALPDGSHISLDSDSRVEVHYSAAARAITLNRGRARFDVEHDPARPFTVSAGPETVVAIGTSFDVERLGAKVLVTLIEGHVVIKDYVPAIAKMVALPRNVVSLTAGQQLVATGGAKPVVTSANIEAAHAWKAGHLLFRGVPLGEAIARVNRYTDHPIIVDPAVASVQISGVFNAGDIGAFVRAITGYFPIDATDGAQGVTLVPRPHPHE
jgi:transmembrane sensor